MLKRFIIFGIILAITFFNSTFANSNENNGIKISNRYFSFNFPAETKGTYKILKKDKGIFVYHTESKKEGFGGFAFGLKLYKNPKDHAMMPGSVKIGELNGKNGTLYDMVLIRPTDVQFNYTKGINKDYMKLYNYAEKVVPIGIKGNEYVKNQGMKGKDLYNEVLQKHVKAIKEKWSSEKLEQENMSYMYNVIAQTNKNVLNKIGFAYYDTNADGIEELLIGEISSGDWKGVIYDIYTMVDRQPKHVVSGGARNRYYVCDDVFICNEYSSGANESGLGVYILEENSQNLFPQVKFKYDNYTNKNQPWFITYGTNDEKWENVTEAFYNERQKVFKTYIRFSFTPLNQYK